VAPADRHGVLPRADHRRDGLDGPAHLRVDPRALPAVARAAQPRAQQWSAVDGAETFATLDAALDACERDCFVIGGGAVYRDALALSDRVYATEVHDTVDGDTYFPELDAAWTRTVASDPVTENGHTLQFCTYDRAG
jgi:dihydrofolate reductase